MKKRLFSVAAVAMALTMALAGCSSSEEKTEEGAEQTEQTEGAALSRLVVGRHSRGRARAAVFLLRRRAAALRGRFDLYARRRMRTAAAVLFRRQSDLG